MTKLNAHYGKNDPYRFALDNDLNLIEGQLIKYIARHRKGTPTADKFGMRDLLAAQGALDRLIVEWKLANPDTTVIKNSKGLYTYQGDGTFIPFKGPQSFQDIALMQVKPPKAEQVYTDSFTKLVPPSITQV